MALETKFTSDGKKVVVLGSLNSQEKIVQEIFVVNGSEIPSGEHFVVKSLHDAPAVSWKEKSLKDLETRYNKDVETYNKALYALEKEYRAKCNLLTERLSYVGKVLKNVNEESFETLVDYLSGNITHIVIKEYSGPKIIPFDDFNHMCEYSKDRLRLLSLYGKDDGTLTYGIGQYTDISGSKSDIFMFNNYESALEKLKEIILNASISDKIIELAKEYDVKLDSEKLNAWISVRIKEYENATERNKEELKKNTETLNRLKTMFIS